MEFSNLRVYQPDGTFKTGGLSISGDRIASAEVSADAVDMGGLYAVPGLVDLHFHGCMGRDFCDGTHEAISTLAKYQAQIGVAAICQPIRRRVMTRRLWASTWKARSFPRRKRVRRTALICMRRTRPCSAGCRKKPAVCSSCAIWHLSCPVRWRRSMSWQARCVSRLRTRQRIITPPAKPSSTVRGR